jgi:hypothetical protein
VSAETPTTYWERRRAGEFERVAAERAAAAAAAAVPLAAPPPDQRVHVPIGSDVELEEAIEEVVGEGGGVSTSGGLLIGTGPPSVMTGIDGQFYLDTDSLRLYGPKSGGAWPPALGRLYPLTPTYAQVKAG